MPDSLILENEVLNYQDVLESISNGVLPLVILLNKDQSDRLKKCKEKIDALLTPRIYMGKLEILSMLYSGKRYGENEQYVSISFEELDKLITLNKISVNFLKIGEETKDIEELITDENIVVTDNGESKRYKLNDLVLEAIKNYAKENSNIKVNQEKDIENKVATLDELYKIIDSNALPTIVKVSLEEWMLVADEDDTNYPLSFLRYFYYLYDRVLDVKSGDVIYYLGINPSKLKEEYSVLRYLIDGNKTFEIDDINIPEKNNSKATITYQDGRLNFDRLFSQAISKDKNQERTMSKIDKNDIF